MHTRSLIISILIVKWENSSTSLVEEVNSFTEDGYLSAWTKTDYTRISIAKIHEGGKIDGNEYYIHGGR